MNVFEELVERRLLSLHTAFMATVVSVEGMQATVQPLNLIKQVGQAAKKQAVVTNVPILGHVKKMTVYSAETPVEVEQAQGHTHGVQVKPHGGHVKLTPIGPGDVVFCVCADRDITQTQAGVAATPALGHHQIRDAVIVGVLS